MLAAGIDRFVEACYLSELDSDSRVASSTLNRLQKVVERLVEIKTELISQLSSNPFVSYSVPNGLGAICISAVEKYVTPTLIEHGFSTSIYLRQYNFSISDSEDSPRIHCYNTVALANMELVIDIDADPFAKSNTGVVIAPLHLGPPIYSSGHLLHERSVINQGKVHTFSFWNIEQGQSILVFKGGNIRSISVANFFGPPEETLCPIILNSGAMILFGVAKFSIGNGPIIHRLYCVLACRRHPNHASKSYEITVQDASSIQVSQTEELNDLVSIKLADGRFLKFEFSLDTGLMVRNRSVAFSESIKQLPEVVRMQVSSRCSLPIVIPISSSEL